MVHQVRYLNLSRYRVMKRVGENTYFYPFMLWSFNTTYFVHGYGLHVWLLQLWLKFGENFIYYYLKVLLVNSLSFLPRMYLMACAEDGKEATNSDAPENNPQYTTVYVGNLAPEARNYVSLLSVLLSCIYFWLWELLNEHL